MPNRKKFFDQPIKVTTDVTTIPTLVGGMQIPFASGESVLTPTTSTTGAPANIFLASYGTTNGTAITLSGGQPYPQILSAIDMTFTAPYTVGTFFTMPCTITVAGIKFTVSSDSTTAINFTGTTYGWVAVATATAPTDPVGNTLTFTILPQTVTTASQPFVKSGGEGAGITLSGENIGLLTTIPAGTLVAIVCGIFTTDGTLAQTSYSGTLSYSGNMLLL